MDVVGGRQSTTNGSARSKELMAIRAAGIRWFLRPGADRWGHLKEAGKPVRRGFKTNPAAEHWLVGCAEGWITLQGAVKDILRPRGPAKRSRASCGPR